MPDRPTSNPPQFVQGSVVLHVPDIQATATYYRDVLGFQWDFGDETYSVVWRDNAAIHFAQGEAAPTGVHVFLWVRDVDECHRGMAERGAEIVVPIRASGQARPLAQLRGSTRAEMVFFTWSLLKLSNRERFPFAWPPWTGL